MRARAEVAATYANFALATFEAHMARRGEFDEVERLRRVRDDVSDTASAGGNAGRGLTRKASSGDITTSQFSRAVDLDVAQAKKFHQDTRHFLTLAVVQFAEALTLGDAHDDNVVRLCSLWLSHHTNDQLNSSLAALLPRIPSSKFVVLSYQLSARHVRSSASSAPSFVKALHGLVTRLCADHPFHTLWQVLSLRTSAKPAASASSSRSKPKRSGGGVGAAALDGREGPAETLLDQLRAVGGLKDRLARLESLARYFQAFAEYAARSHTGFTNDGRGLTSLDVPDTLKIRGLSAPDVPIPTLSLAIDPTCKYEPRTLPCIQQYETTFIPLSGISAPKVIGVRATDGQSHKELVRR